MLDLPAEVSLHESSTLVMNSNIRSPCPRCSYFTQGVPAHQFQNISITWWKQPQTNSLKSHLKTIVQITLYISQLVQIWCKQYCYNMKLVFSLFIILLIDDLKKKKDVKSVLMNQPSLLHFLSKCQKIGNMRNWVMDLP